MRTHNETGLAHGPSVTSREPPQLELSVAVRGVFRLLPGGGLEPITDVAGAGPITGDQFLPVPDEHGTPAPPWTGELVYPSDLAPFKLQTDLVLIGWCHAPHGEPVTVCPVTFGVGDWSKSLVVVGRRTWQGGRMSEPLPFTSQPLAWQLAFGGEGYDANPVGTGLHNDRLPLVERPDALIRGTGDRPAPAAFGPVSPHWPARAALRGRNYGEEWRCERSPWFADDFDWHYFNAAQPDQQLPDYLRGDERVYLRNLLPDAPEFTAQLPALRVRAFVLDASGDFRELEMNLDTLVVDTSRGRLHLVWRGLTPINEIDMSDVHVLVIGAEPQGDEPLPESHYREQADALAAPPPVPEEPAEELPEPPEVEIRELDESVADEATRQAMQDSVADLPSGAQDQIAQGLNEIAAEVASSGDPAAKAALSAVVAAAAATTPASGANGPAGTAITPQNLQDHLASVQQEVANAGGDPGMLAELDKAVNDSEMQQLIEEIEADDVTPEISTTTDEFGNVSRDLSGHDFAGQDLRAEDFTGCNLATANFSESDLRGVSFVGADCTAAVFADARLDEADFTGADLTDAVFDHASMMATLLTGATLARTGFARASMVQATLIDTTGERALFTGADLTACVASGASLVGAAFDNGILVGADFSRADLSKVSMRGVDADGASFAEAVANGFCGGRGTHPAKFTNTDFTAFDADGSVWLDADMSGAHFPRAVLQRSLFTGATLAGTDFTRTNLRGAAMRQTQLDGTVFEFANLYDTDLTGAHGTAPRFAGANIFQTVLTGTHLPGADFTGARTDLAIRNDR